MSGKQIKTLLRCPVCSKALFEGDKSYFCESNHSFDKAAQGYVHLLKPNQMHAKIPGDNAEMVASRKRFLSGGYYCAFSEMLCRLVTEELAALKHPVLLDAGCGEGYYTSAMEKSLIAAGKQASIYGFDISKFAVKAACARKTGIRLFVASCFDIPFESGAADALAAIFSPIVPTEFARVLKRGGIMLLAVAGERHLWGLKQALYEKPYLNEQRDTEYDGFRFIKRVPVKGRIALNSRELIGDLFAMTPYYWKTPKEGCERLKALDSLETEIAFDFLLYRRL